MNERTIVEDLEFRNNFMKFHTKMICCTADYSCTGRFFRTEVCWVPGHAAVAALTGRGAAVVTVLTGEVAARVGCPCARLRRSITSRDAANVRGFVFGCIEAKFYK